MAATQTAHRITVTTKPKLTASDGSDVLLLVGFRGHEGISELFNFQLDVIVENKNKDLVLFEKLLGQVVTINFQRENCEMRYFSGICASIGQGEQDESYTCYGIEIVPRFELLNKRAQCRIFQHETVPDILNDVFTGAGMKKGTDWDFDLASSPPFQKRNYCVQYRESDFNFASRLMEEEGIYYYFVHSDSGHKMIVSNKIQPNDHPKLSDQEIVYENVADAPEGTIYDWSKVQQLTASSYTLRDACFELPGDPLQALDLGLDTVTAGKVTHKLQPDGADFDIYDYPGEYAQRFDGVPKEGSGKQDDVGKQIGDDGSRTSGIRMDQETAQALYIRGASKCGNFVSGFKFTLHDQERQDSTVRNGKSDFNGSGDYLLTSIQHACQGDSYRSDQGAFAYSNMFTCIPIGLPYRPLRRTLKPTLSGTQTAVVVGPKDQEIWTDKYGRVKVQFPWFRGDEKDQKQWVKDSSCWVRVAQVWAGARWGASFWPRIGQEVVVAFLEGDPDRPIIIGSVYNAKQLPPYLGEPPNAPGPDSKHPRDPKVSGIKTNTTPGGVGFNELRFDDTKDKQQLFMHAERNMDVRVKGASMESIGGPRSLTVGGDQYEQVAQDKHLHVKGKHFEKIEGDMQLLVVGDEHLVVQGDKKEGLSQNYSLNVTSDRKEKVGGNQSLTVGGNQQEKVGQKHALDAGTEVHIKAGTTLVLEAGTQLSLKVGSNFISIDSSGVTIVGTMVMINSGGAAGSGSGSSPTSPDDPTQASPKDPSPADDAKTGFKSAPDQ